MYTHVLLNFSVENPITVASQNSGTCLLILISQTMVVVPTLNKQMTEDGSVRAIHYAEKRPNDTNVQRYVILTQDVQNEQK